MRCQDGSRDESAGHEADDGDRVGPGSIVRPRLIPLLADKPLARNPGRAVRRAAAASSAGASSTVHRDLRERTECKDGDIFFDVTDQDLEGYNKFVPYYLHPESCTASAEQKQLSREGFGGLESVGATEPTINLAKSASATAAAATRGWGPFLLTLPRKKPQEKPRAKSPKNFVPTCAMNVAPLSRQLSKGHPALAATVNHRLSHGGNHGRYTHDMNARPTPGPLLLRAEHLGRKAGDKILIDDANFEVKKGEVLAIAGPSGSGKTSLLRLLNRLDEPTSGTVFVEGIDYRDIKPRDLRRKLGLVTQRPYLFPGTVAENLRFGPSQRGEVLAQDVIEQLLTQVGLAGFAGREVANLSGGEAQRVSVARTLANSPVVLLLDEPTSALDEAAKRDVEDRHSDSCTQSWTDLRRGDTRSRPGNSSGPTRFAVGVRTHYARWLSK